MVYVIAAYTITAGVLALYGVLLQHRGRVFAAEQDMLAGETPAGRSRGFNLGAALLSPFWMWAHGMRWPGLILLGMSLALVPLYVRGLWTPFMFVALVPVAAGAALGFVGNRIAIEYRGAESLAEFSRSQLPWANAGIGLHAIVLPWAWYLLSASS